MPWEAKYLLVALLYFVLLCIWQAAIGYRNDLPNVYYLMMGWIMVTVPAVLLLWVLGA